MNKQQKTKFYPKNIVKTKINLKVSKNEIEK